MLKRTEKPCRLFTLFNLRLANPRTSSRETKSTKLISARPLATGANWPIAVEGGEDIMGDELLPEHGAPCNGWSDRGITLCVSEESGVTYLSFVTFDGLSNPMYH